MPAYSPDTSAHSGAYLLPSYMDADLAHFVYLPLGLCWEELPRACTEEWGTSGSVVGFVGFLRQPRQVKGQEKNTREERGTSGSAIM
jgi:hypothetical protein